VSGAPQLEVRDLAVAFRTDSGRVTAVHDVSFAVAPGETLALVGESGSGKSVTSLAVMRLLPAPPRTTIAGQVLLRGRDGPMRDLARLSEEDMRQVRGNEIAMIFQEPLTSLNPVHAVGPQIAEALAYHRGMGRRAALARAVELLDLVGIPDPVKRLSSYPHQLSGGMRQRVMIAIALACDPSVLIADEPTTALDVTVQAQILDLLKDLQARTGMSILFITHNLGVVAEIADRVMVMYAGRIVEQGEVAPLLTRPLMPYTAGLLRAVPRLDRVGEAKGELEMIGGNVPDPSHLPAGCSFHPRCPHVAMARCDRAIPGLEDAGAGHLVRCLRWREIPAGEA
jgi:oligopeptide transport system ATP-binding protein